MHSLLPLVCFQATAFWRSLLPSRRAANSPERVAWQLMTELYQEQQWQPGNLQQG
jgi:hypothetical protein